MEMNKSYIYSIQIYKFQVFTCIWYPGGIDPASSRRMLISIQELYHCATVLAVSVGLEVVYMVHFLIIYST